ncbi:auxin response factor 12-like [Phoenix dactylifera]|uniref:Auxin response factor 12-like n=1 Tax=Phoenix dactylifera TaxID=42345 RepID=A0A8B8ZLD5_PHODC|nr:auxin response factor 12-like [Phoenix dactylifera]
MGPPPQCLQEDFEAGCVSGLFYRRNIGGGNKEDEGSGFIWPKGDAGERGIQSLNFQSLAMGPWVQQSLEPLLLGNELNLCQAISAAALQEIRGGDFMMQQFLQYQQPFSFPQQSCRNNPLLQQQIFQQTPQEQIVIPQSQCVTENLAHSVPDQQLQRTHNEQQKQQVQQPQTYAEAFQIPKNHMHQQQSPLPPHCIQRMLGSSYAEGNATILNCSRLGNPIISEQNQQPWEPRFTMSQVAPFGSTVMLPSFAEKDTSVGCENCANLQNHTLYGLGKDFPSSLSIAVPNNSLYGYLDGSSGSLQSAAEIDPATQMFVKVYKSGSVGRSLDISQYSSYDELRQELGQMFGIEGLLNDPLRSGWQLVFVDRENDVLLLGDDPWE